MKAPTGEFSNIPVSPDNSWAGDLPSLHGGGDSRDEFGLEQLGGAPAVVEIDHRGQDAFPGAIAVHGLAGNVAHNLMRNTIA